MTENLASSIILINKKYHTVRTIPKSYHKNCWSRKNRYP